MFLGDKTGLVLFCHFVCTNVYMMFLEYVWWVLANGSMYLSRRFNSVDHQLEETQLEKATQLTLSL